MVFRQTLVLVTCILAVWSLSVVAAEQTMKEDKSHVYLWNKFARDLVALHKKLIKNRKITTKTRVGGYTDDPKYYTETRYFDARTGKLISVVQKENNKDKKLHVIEVYVRDRKGRVIRDYSATYLPHARNAPVQTLINLHGYGKKMHGFRQFDATGDLIYEQCAGVYKNKKITIRLFEDELVNGGSETDRIMKSRPYKLCFKGVSDNVKKLLKNPK